MSELPSRALPDRVAHSLYQGPKPPPGQYNVDMIVLMAEEYQPSSENFPGSYVIHAPIDDNPMGITPREKAIIDETATIVARALRRKKSVLVTCNMGLNRSGVVSGLALKRAYPTVSGERAVELVQQARGMWALSNPHFEAIVRGD